MWYYEVSRLPALPKTVCDAYSSMVCLLRVLPCIDGCANVCIGMGGTMICVWIDVYGVGYVDVRAVALSDELTCGLTCGCNMRV